MCAFIKIEALFLFRLWDVLFMFSFRQLMTIIKKGKKKRNSQNLLIVNKRIHGDVIILKKVFIFYYSKIIINLL